MRVLINALAINQFHRQPQTLNIAIWIACAWFGFGKKFMWLPGG